MWVDVDLSTLLDCGIEPTIAGLVCACAGLASCLTCTDREVKSWTAGVLGWEYMGGVQL